MEKKNKEVIISVKNLTKDYGRGRGIFDISFDEESGKAEIRDFRAEAPAKTEKTVPVFQGFGI